MKNRLLFLLLIIPFFVQTQVIDYPINVKWENIATDNKILLNSNTQYIYEGELVIILNNNSYISKKSIEILEANFIDISEIEKPDSLFSKKFFSYNVKWRKGRNGWIPTLYINPLVGQSSGLKLLTSFKLRVNESIKKSNTLIDADVSIVFKDESVLASGTWTKLSIDKSGVFKIDNTLMGQIASNLGVAISDIDPRKIGVFGQKGGMLPEKNLDYDYDDLKELSLEIVGGNDGVFDNDDYMLFYAEGPDSWKINSTGVASNKKNIYSDFSYLFITIKDDLGKRISEVDKVTTEANQILNTYNSFEFHELDEVNFIDSGQDWFGENLVNNSDFAVSFDFPNRDTSKDITVKTGFGISYLNSSTVDVFVNENREYSVGLFTNNSQKQVERTSVTVDADEEIVVSFDIDYGGKGKCLLDYVEVSAISKLVAQNKQYSFRNIESINISGVSEFRISNPENIRSIWNVTNPLTPQKILLSSGVNYDYFRTDSDIIEEYILITNDDFLIPEVIGKVENQNLHGNTAVDYIIVSHKDFINSAEKLASFHREKGLVVNVVDIEQIYNEFSSGRQDLIAIRQYVRMLYKRGGFPSKLKYLLLYGDASYDFKDKINNNTNYVPSYQGNQYIPNGTYVFAYVSDDYFGLMDDNEGDGIFEGDLLDIAIGRIPIMSDKEGDDIVYKIENYNSNESFGDWRNKIQFVADDVSDKTRDLMQDSEALSQSLSERNSNYNHQKVYLDTYQIERTSGRNTYPQAHIDLMQNVQNGNLVTNYFGHGNEEKWTGEELFDIGDIDNFSNINNLPLFVTVTCEFSRFDNPGKYTGGEKLLAYKDGGGIGLFSTTRVIYVGVGKKINKKILELLLPENNRDPISLGEVLRLVKNSVLDKGKRTVSLFGDPAMMLAYPEKEIYINSINYNDLGVADTLKSLMKVYIEGEIRSGSVKDESFNGVAYPLVFDKKQELESLDNNNFGKITPYWIQKNVIYKGKSEVNNGEFTMEFVVPKDINYSFGKGKISFYAISDNTDASGSDSDIIVGGVDVLSNIDIDGPKMNVYMNNEFFADGGITNSSPVFMADLEDISGINTVGNGIGHDLKMTLINEETYQEILLNEFYESAMDDFTKGKVSYKMFGLEPGSYTINIVAWDVFNNSSNSKLHFYVKSDEELLIKDIINYPNPFNDETTFKFSHNRPNKTLSVKIEIFTIYGMPVKTIFQDNNYDGFVVNDIVWNGKSDKGANLPSGTYIYKVSTISENGISSNQEVNKLIIIR